MAMRLSECCQKWNVWEWQPNFEWVSKGCDIDAYIYTFQRKVLMFYSHEKLNFYLFTSKKWQHVVLTLNVKESCHCTR